MNQRAAFIQVNGITYCYPPQNRISILFIILLSYINAAWTTTPLQIKQPAQREVCNTWKKQSENLKNWQILNAKFKFKMATSANLKLQ